MIFTIYDRYEYYYQITDPEPEQGDIEDVLILYVFSQNPSSCDQLHGAWVNTGVMRVRRPLQPGRGGPLSGQRSQHKPTAYAGPTSGHARRAAQVRPGNVNSCTKTRFIEIR